MPHKILVVGAGKSTSCLLDYFLEKAQSEHLHLTIGDLHPETIAESIKNHEACSVLKLDIFNDEARRKLVQGCDIVVSMLPASLHIQVAKDCAAFDKHLVTASYVSEELMALNSIVKAKGLVFMNEIGLDPGIDHMSAMQIIDRIRDAGGNMLLFESFTGGLVAPESDNNLWNYKASDGRGIRLAMDFLYPYIADKSSWPHKPDVQSWQGWPTRPSALIFAGVAYRESKFLQLWSKLEPDPKLDEIQRNLAITQPVLWLQK